MTGMQRPVNRSSTIAGVGYDADTQTMEVEFTNGRRYTFEGVPPDVYEGLLTADSPGSYFNLSIKGQY